MANSLKDLITSVDWSKMVSGNDVRNALIGSALGGLALGGAGLLQDRDPEESKLAPLGDALLGAVLGGVAGYGIPKGLALYRDAGSLAPDDDRLQPVGYKWPAIGGAAAGTALFGGMLTRTLLRNKNRIREEALNDLPNWRARAESHLANVKGTPRETLAQHMLDMLHTDQTASEQVFADLRRTALSRMASGDIAGARDAWKELSVLKRYRKRALRGYNGINDFLNRVAAEPIGKDVNGVSHGDPAGLLTYPFRKGHWRDGLPHVTHGAHYVRKSLPLIGTILGPKSRIPLRAGKYALGGAALITALAALRNRFGGPSVSDNFKK